MKPPNPDPTWSPEVMALYRHDLREIWDRSVAPHIWNQYHDQIDRYLAIAGDAPLKILDVGCAQGTLALILAERGHDVTALDLRAEFLEYAKSRHTHGNVRFVQMNALEEELPDGFDLVFANQLIEHVVHPARLVSRLMKALHPGGRLVVTTPNGRYLRNALPSFRELGDAAQWEHLQFTADGDGHFFAYRADELLDVFEACGLREIRAKFFESPWISGHMRIRHLHSWVPTGALRALDRATLALPWLGSRMAHQLLVTGTAP